MTTRLDGRFAAVTGAASGNGRAIAEKQLTRALAVEAAPSGIRVNAVAPGFIDGGWTIY